MAHYKLYPSAHGDRARYKLVRQPDGAASGEIVPVDPAPAVEFTFGHLAPVRHTSLSAVVRFLRRNDHIVEVLS